ncbi:MAG: hypothetical protein CVU16_07570 [Betaproteobacteria bacterium HGW-Betaproteobacteria-10]|nr:MAG: hypothetical protein CVU16_07570 [Betaproteobacteria bacterium HGW-Betaproteobacteria-10]
MAFRLTALTFFLTSLAICAHAAPTAVGLAQANTISSVQLMNTPRPLFFSDLVPFDTEHHRSLTLPAQRKNFAFAASAHLLPLTVAEVGAAVQHYPVVFIREGDIIALVALTGLPNAGNRFVDAQGEWRADTYIPAYVRGYPFIAVRPAPGAEPIIAFDPSAADFKVKNGQVLIGSDGQPGEQLKGILAFHGEYQALTERTHTITQALQAEGLLEEGQINVQVSGNPQPAPIGGFLVVSEARLRALSAEALKRLMDADAIGLAYAHLLSMSRLGNLVGEAPVKTIETVSSPARQRAGKKSAE